MQPGIVVSAQKMVVTSSLYQSAGFLSVTEMLSVCTTCQIPLCSHIVAEIDVSSFCGLSEIAGKLCLFLVY